MGNSKFQSTSGFQPEQINFKTKLKIMNGNLAYWLFGIGLFLMGLSYAIGFLRALSEQKLDGSKFMLATDIGSLKYPAVLIAFLLGLLISGIGYLWEVL